MTVSASALPFPLPPVYFNDINSNSVDGTSQLPTLPSLCRQLDVVRALLDDGLLDSASLVAEMATAALAVYAAKPVLFSTNGGIATSAGLVDSSSSVFNSGSEWGGTSSSHNQTADVQSSIALGHPPAILYLFALSLVTSGEALASLKRHRSAISTLQRAVEVLNSLLKHLPQNPGRQGGAQANGMGLAGSELADNSEGATSSGHPQVLEVSGPFGTSSQRPSTSSSPTDTIHALLIRTKELCATSEAEVGDWTQCSHTLQSIPEHERSVRVLRLLARVADRLNDTRLAYNTHLSILNRHPYALESYSALARIAQHTGQEAFVRLGGSVPVTSTLLHSERGSGSGVGTWRGEFQLPGRKIKPTRAPVGPNRPPVSVLEAVQPTADAPPVLGVADMEDLGLFKDVPRVRERLAKAKEDVEWCTSYVSAEARMSEGGWDRALKLLSSLNRSYPDCIPLHAAMSECEYQLGRIQGAWQGAMRIRQLDKHAVDFMDRYADMLFAQKDLVKLNLLSTSVSNSCPQPPPHTPIPSYIFSRYCDLRATFAAQHPEQQHPGESDESKTDETGWRERTASYANRCTEGYGATWAGGWALKGALALEHGKYDDAVRFYAKARRWGGAMDIGVLQGLATAYLHQKHWVNVSRLVADVHRVMPNNPRALVVVGVVRTSMAMNLSAGSADREKEEAVEVLKRALELDSTSVEVVVALSSAYINAGKVKEAIAIVRLGDVLALDGQTARAIEYYNRALRLDPASEAARNGLKRLEEQDRDAMGDLPLNAEENPIQTFKRTHGREESSIESTMIPVEDPSAHSPNSTPSILVTGGCGYIGSHTLVELLSRGREVIVVDDLSNSSNESIRRAEKLGGKPVLAIYNISVCDGQALRDVFRRHTIESVIHFAGLKSVTESTTDPLKYYNVNVGGMITLLEVMKEFKVFHLVFSSSATVYGHPQIDGPIPETHPVAPTNPYGRTKLMCEDIAKDLAAGDPRFKIALLRYFNPIGAHPSGQIGEDPNSIPNNLIPYVTQVLVGRLPFLRVFGNDYNTVDGTGVRDFIHVSDLAVGHVSALEYLRKQSVIQSGDKENLWIWNMGTGRGFSVLEVVRAIENAAAKSVPLVMVPRRPGDCGEVIADISKANRDLDWRATRGIEDMAITAWLFQNTHPDGYRTAPKDDHDTDSAYDTLGRSSPADMLDSRQTLSSPTAETSTAPS
ncbi:hypothetical protein HDU93_001032 [Gonapodya sp. JEL0774]|nr:hypothetical protein HDU93_001032 [Gonapodya sp. JEL0774]